MYDELTNLWEETVEILERNGLSFDDVKQVQVSEGYINKEWFKVKAMTTNYDSGYGTAEIRLDLLIIGDGWWLERGEYDGSEWWDFKAQPALVDKEAENFSLME